MKYLPAFLGAGLAATIALGEPLIPTIIGHDFNFGAYNHPSAAVEYATNGLSADTLVYTAHALPDHEVTAYWPNWPDPPVYPVWDGLQPATLGGEFVMGVQLTGQDAPAGPFVSLVGTGLYANQPDLLIYGMADFGGGDIVSGLLWALDLEAVSLYGYAGWPAYSLEGVGTIVDGLVPQRFGLIGRPGAVRGHLDFRSAPAGWMPPQYHPLQDPRVIEVRAAYSGETGLAIPEPAAILLAMVSLTVARRRGS